jgi:mediator of RNA polymerase II transcription subunit 25
MQQEVQAPAPGVGMQNMSPFSNAANLPMNMFVSCSIVRVRGICQ